MPDSEPQYLLRDDAPLSDAQWSTLDQAVANAARGALVGRRFMPLFGPLGGGVQAVGDDEYTGVGPGTISRDGAVEDDVIVPTDRRMLMLPMVFKDFQLHWRDIESSRQFGLPLDTGAPAAAAVATAAAEDHLIFHGDATLGLPGLLTVDGTTGLTLADWNETGQGFQDVVAATQALTEQGFAGPFALVVHPRRYAMLNRVHSDAGVLEIEQVQKLTAAGIYRTPVLGNDIAVVVATGPQNLDLVVGQDIVCAFRETVAMNHIFRVFETVTPRIKRPAAIAVLRT